MALTALRSKVESALVGRVPAPFTYRDRKVMETVSAGISTVDLWAALLRPDQPAVFGFSLTNGGGGSMRPR
jgi:hypothetical protein